MPNLMADAQNAVIQTAGQQPEAFSGAMGDRQTAKRTGKQPQVHLLLRA
jgi:hypothetical protein